MTARRVGGERPAVPPVPPERAGNQVGGGPQGECQRRLLHRLDSLPAEIIWTGATPRARTMASKRGSLPSTSQKPASARQVHRQARNHRQASRIEASRRVTEKASGVHTPSLVVVRVPLGTQRRDPCLKSLSTGRHRHRGDPWQSERLRAGVEPPTSRLAGPRSGGRLWFFQKKTAAAPVEPVGGLCPSKEVWETLP